MELDLRPDVPRLRAVLAEAVSLYARRHKAPETRALYPAVKRIDLAYTFGFAEVPLISLNFDTKSGEPTHAWSHPKIADIEYPRWNPARLVAEDGGRVTLHTPWGSIDVEGEEGFDRAIGEFFVRLIRGARDEGLFEPLPRAHGCEFGVHAYDGFFGWPCYENRGKENLL